MHACIIIVGEEFVDNYSGTDDLFHLAVTEGNTIFIPCIPALGTQETVSWEIGTSLYPNFDLPYLHEPSIGGIIVHNFTFGTNTNMMYTCYKSSTKEVSMIQLTESRSEDERTPNICLRHMIKLVSNGVFLHGDTHYNFQFQVLDNTMQLTNEMTTMSVTNDIISLWNKSSNESLPKFSPPKEMLTEEKNSYAEVYSTTNNDQVCARLNYLITVDITGKSILIYMINSAVIIYR